MSLTYSLNPSGQPSGQSSNQQLSRVAIITFIVMLHVGAFIAFNNGIGHFFKTQVPNDMTIVDVPTDPPTPTPLPIPDIPKSIPEQTLAPPIVDPTTVVIDSPPIVSDSPPAQATDANPVTDAIPTVSKLTVTSRIEPVYPASAQAAGKQGVVLLDAQVDPNGNVVAVNILRSSGFSELDAAAVQAVKRWHFASVSTGAHVRVPIRFQLNVQKH